MNLIFVLDELRTPGYKVAHDANVKHTTGKYQLYIYVTTEEPSNQRVMNNNLKLIRSLGSTSVNYYNSH